MNIVGVLLIVLLLCGSGWGFYGGNHLAGGGMGLVLLILIILLLCGRL